MVESAALFYKKKCGITEFPSCFYFVFFAVKLQAVISSIDVAVACVYTLNVYCR